MTPYRRYTWADNAGALTVDAIRACKKQIEAHAAEQTVYLLSDAVRIDTNGVVCFPGGWMHPESFRSICGEDAYQALLKLPRVQSEFTNEELAEPSEPIDTEL